MNFSLVLATVDRVSEVGRFIQSLRDQSVDHIQLVVVDQNSDDRLATILGDAPSCVDIVHIVSPKGASIARNAGLLLATGDVIGFPDDDCWYAPGTLRQVQDMLSAKAGLSGVTGALVDEHGLRYGSFDKESGEVNKLNVWRRGTCLSMFFTRTAVDSLGAFDETLGVGASTPWKSGEETDYLLRAIDKGFDIWYDPSLMIGHPVPVGRYDRHDIDRALNYGRGMGRVLRKHHYDMRFIAWTMIRPLGGAMLSIGTMRWKKAQYHWNVFKGRLEGWMDRSPFS
jgi:glycosyltransferase involved in cell wall biosynthesis